MVFEVDLLARRFRASASPPLDEPFDDFWARVEDRRQAELALRTHLAGLSSVFEVTFRVTSPGGAERWLRARGSARVGSDGRPFAVAGSTADVTEERERAARLQRAEELCRELAHGGRDAIVVHRNGRIVYASGLAEIGGGARRAVAGAAFLSLFAPGNRAAAARAVRAGTDGAALELAQEVGCVPVTMDSRNILFDGEPAIHSHLRRTPETPEAQPLVFARSVAAELTERMLGHYRVLYRLGGGGMGEVFAAEDTRLGRRVALKVLPPTSDPAVVARFEEEARAAASVNHPSVVAVYDVGEAEGIRYLATELIEGETLRERLSRGGVPLDEALLLGEQVAAALGAVHRAGVLHLDVKPENLVLRADGVVKLIDFGIAQRIGGTDPKRFPIAALIPGSVDVSGTDTWPDLVFGTPDYMAPEQVRGLGVDERSDLFSLGGVLYELCTGRRPFHGGDAREVLASLAECDPPHPSRIAPSLPHELVELLLQALRREPSKRYQTADEMLAALRAARRSLARLPAPREALSHADAGSARATVPSRPGLLGLRSAPRLRTAAVRGRARRIG